MDPSNRHCKHTQPENRTNVFSHYVSMRAEYIRLGTLNGLNSNFCLDLAWASASLYLTQMLFFKWSLWVLPGILVYSNKALGNSLLANRTKGNDKLFPDLYEASVLELQAGLEAGDFSSVDLVKVLGCQQSLAYIKLTLSVDIGVLRSNRRSEPERPSPTRCHRTQSICFDNRSCSG